MIDFSYFEKITSCERIPCEPTISYVSRMIRVFDTLPDDDFYSLDLETRLFVNSIIMRIVRE